MPEGWSLSDPEGLDALHRMIEQHAEFMAYLDDFRLLAVIVVFLAPFVFLMRIEKLPETKKS